MPREGGAAVDAHGHHQEHGMIQVNVCGHAGHLPAPPSGLAALLTLGGRQAVAEVADRTESVVEGGRR